VPGPIRSKYVEGLPAFAIHHEDESANFEHDDFSEIIKRADYKSAWHFAERDDLTSSIRAHRSSAIVVGVDFNAPRYSTNVAIDGIHNAHLDAGSGAHLSIPARFPIWGLDHTIGNDRIIFTDYRLIDTGFSDHRAQLVRFRVTHITR
jgi:endonuclease/exonuclease/phosphatase (EEP) superfamily protein YafD